MTKHYLLAADADKIQDFIFRSAYLQEVIGGSHLLSRFCDEGLEALHTHYAGAKYKGKWVKGSQWDVIINDGGRFLLWFDDHKHTQEFGHDLVELYRRTIEGSLTIAVAAENEGYNPESEDEFTAARKKIECRLKQAKSDTRGAKPAIHVPQMAFCASCGIALALEHVPLYENPMYLCSSCLNKGDERDYLRRSLKNKKYFINDFRQAIVDDKSNGFSEKHLWLPVKPVDAISQFDPRSYVAYLIADCNSMGGFFNQCKTRSQMRALSEKLRAVLYHTLSKPVSLLKQRLEPKFGNQKCKAKEDRAFELKNILPAVPLILGGDDIFLLLPAPYAVDFTKHFIKAFEDEMVKALQSEEIKLDGKPTLSAAVVICKSNYPYKLAHRHGEELLNRAKRMAKTFANEPRSVIDVEVILSSERRSTEPDEPRNSGYESSLRPFWANGDSNDAGISIQNLIAARTELDKLPNKRLAQLRPLYYSHKLPRDKQDSLADWNQELEHLLGRVKRMEAPEMNTSPASGSQQTDKDSLETKLRRVLKTLGDGNEQGQAGHWKNVKRGPEAFDAHALPDLLTMWDYCYDLDVPYENYQ
ncbi:hypothetical protein HUU40_05480 [candidate division KSB1 bacterium]|nr:hypothetical protein [candidate division KSB1 bacterium]